MPVEEEEEHICWYKVSGNEPDTAHSAKYFSLILLKPEDINYTHPYTPRIL
jgi:hypothetical protein